MNPPESRAAEISHKGLARERITGWSKHRARRACKKKIANSPKTGLPDRGGVFFCALVAAVYLAALSSCALLGGTAFRNGTDIDIIPRRQTQANTCALACIEAVLEYWDIRATGEEIREKLGETPEEGYTLGQLRDLARAYGLKAYIVKGDISFLKHHTGLGRPVIVTLKRYNTNHSVIVLEAEPDGPIIAMDPAPGGLVRISGPVFLRQWEELNKPALLVAPGT